MGPHEMENNYISNLRTFRNPPPLLKLFLFENWKLFEFSMLGTFPQFHHFIFILKTPLSIFIFKMYNLLLFRTVADLDIIEFAT